MVTAKRSIEKPRGCAAAGEKAAARAAAAAATIRSRRLARFSGLL